MPIEYPKPEEMASQRHIQNRHSLTRFNCCRRIASLAVPYTSKPTERINSRALLCSTTPGRSR